MGDRATVTEMWHGGAVTEMWHGTLWYGGVVLLGAVVHWPLLARSPDFLFKPLFGVFVRDLPGSPLETF